jgi:hypothetical protein
VNVSNPNAYLLNQLGLINPAEVIWDLIPWSFLFGAVSNMNALLSSFTAEVGLTVTNRSTTFTGENTMSLFRWYRPVKTAPMSTAMSSRFSKRKTRTVGSFTPVQFRFKAPVGDWETVLIQSSLLVQRFQKINKLIRI